MKLSSKTHLIPEPQRLWLQEMVKTKPFDPRVAKVKLMERIPDDFDPRTIDRRLCVEGKLTPIGVWHLDQSNEIFQILDKIIRTIKARIIELPGISEISAEELARRTGIDEGKVVRALKSLGDLGNFVRGSSNSPDGEGYLKIFLVGDDAYDEYLRYKDIDTILERYYTTRDPANLEPNYFTFETLLQNRVNPAWRGTAQTVEHKSVKPNTAFVLMAIDPSKPELVDVYEAIKEGCKEFGIVAYRADEIQHQDKITDRILHEIETCEYLISDLSYERPNVYYEVGYAHAKNKKPILFRRAETRLHFDLSVHNVPEYKNATELRELLRKRLEAILGRAGKPTK